MSIFNHHVLQTSGSLRVFLSLFNLASRNCCFILYGRLFFDRSSPFDLGLLQGRRYPVENIDETYSTLCKIRCPVEETTKMARHAALPVHQGNARRAPYYRQELVESVVSVDCKRLA